MTRLFILLMAVFLTSACNVLQRSETAAPVVRVTPREPAPEAPPTVAETTPPERPQRQPTRVFAYRDPAVATAPETSEPAPSAPVPTEQEGPRVATAPPESGPVAPTAAPAVAPPAPAPAAPSPSAPVLSEPAPPAPETQVALIPSAPPLGVEGLAPAAESLARQAEQQRQAGDFAGAAASLERALRIAPREPYLWNRLARVRLEQGQSAQAGNLASRSNNLAGNTPAIRQDNWRIIAEARRRSGDLDGAGEAEQRASDQ
ncbi:hypothetical protein CKO25_04625 [Thiocapsa imhoffii]|uniref:Tetratricopeptide repeat protein n=1 Tax=Thiocapsa imhoffii TaxID=382777 RepID=A0A9X1B866_9GAMM|nr:tetratricopeptide repeat protein [Thiocapsa imhoffii]MBK1643953.1 hypothetical protein [Thiocapsa imhoffii]